MNYPLVERALLNVQNLIKNLFSNYLKGINDILIGFTVAIFILNFILICVTIFFIYEFITVLKWKLVTIKATLISFPGNHLFAHHCIIQYLIIIFLKLPSLRRYNSYLSKPSHTGQSCCSIYSVRHDCHLQFNNIIDKV